MSSPLASVIIPVYNTEAYLEQCVQSVQGQTYSNLEIILVDDGSTDGSGALCDRLALLDARVRVIHQKNSGVSAARNAALDAARGVYIYFADSDDWVKETLVEETVATMERTGYDICTWGHDIVQENGDSVYGGRWREKLFQFSTPAAKRKFLCRWVMTGRLDWSVWSRVFRRETIEEHGLRFSTEQTIFEDLDFVFRYLAVCRNLYYIPKSFYCYRQRESSALHANSLQVWTVNTLSMVRRQNRILSDVPVFQPFYIYGGTVLAVLLDNFVKDQPLEQGLALAASYLRSTEDWDYLQEQARLGTTHRAAILRACGLRLGERVYGFYQYLLTSNPADYRRANRLQTCYQFLRGLKNKLLHG